MEIFQIENEHLTLKVSSLGAEWNELWAFTPRVQCLWSGRAEVWARRAPVLFPIVGRLREGKMHWRDQALELPQHGFARDREFELRQASDQHLAFVLSTPHAEFPFVYELEITHSVKGPTVTTRYGVRNLSETERMPFSLGAHPGFNHSWYDSVRGWHDGRITFERQERGWLGLRDGLLDLATPHLSSVHGQGTAIGLNHGLSDDQAQIYLGPKSKWVEVGPASGQRRLRVEWNHATAVGIWSKKVSEFVCLEPWWGWPEPANTTGDLTTKPGMIWLEPQTSWQAEWNLTVQNP